MAMMDKSEKVPKQIKPVFDAVVVLTDAFCKRTSKRPIGF